MPFVSRSQVKRPRPVGRPPKQIPPKLVAILDETFTGNCAFQENITSMEPDDLRELINLGELHAYRRGLSFRHRITEDDDGQTILSIWICRKQNYNRKAAA
jgi:hypothetical protein